MTEAEWKTCVNPMGMLTIVEPANQRKLILFACACYGRIRDLLGDERSLYAIDVAERFADGLVSLAELSVAADAATAAFHQADAACGKSTTSPQRRSAALAAYAVAAGIGCAVGGNYGPQGMAGRAAVQAAGARAVAAEGAVPLGTKRRIRAVAARDAARNREASEQCEIIREVFGNPDHAATFEVRWATPSVVRLAQAIYEGQCFDQLLVLADALDEAGCTDRVALDHLRSPGPHLRGCWPVDLVLAK